MKLLVPRAVSQNGVLTEMSEALARALAAEGVETRLLDLAGADWAGGLAAAIRDGGFDYTIVFSSFAADLATADGRSMFDALGCGFVGWDVDHPAYQFRRFKVPIVRRLQVAASASHLDFVRALAGDVRTAAMLPGVERVAEAPTPLADRPVPLTVAMSWLGEPTAWWAEWKGAPAYALIDGVAERMLADPRADLARAWAETLAATGFAAPLDENMCNILARVAFFVRQHDRLRLAEWLAAGDVPAVICGRGWRERLGAPAHLTYLDDLPYGALAELYGRSRAVLNLNAANGASERALAGLAAGALVVSDDGPLLAAELGQGLRLFDRRDPGTIEAALAADGAQAVADAGRALVTREHLWPAKARRLLAELAALQGESAAA